MHPFFRTRPGQALIAGLAIKLVVLALRAALGAVPSLVGTVDTLASVAIAVGGTLFLVRELASIRRQLLWRVRRKLIISYIFIGVVPAILIVAFFLLGGLLLFSNFSSYLVQNRLRTLADRAQTIAETTAVEIQRMGRREAANVLTKRHTEAAAEFPGLSFAEVRTDVFTWKIIGKEDDPAGVAVGDVNRDGRLDVAALGAGDGAEQLAARRTARLDRRQGLGAGRRLTVRRRDVVKW